MGPNARTLLSRVTDAGLSNPSFPFGTAQQISIGFATVRAVRITYVGELGWELHVPMEQLALVYETLTEAGATLASRTPALRDQSLRLGKGLSRLGRGTFRRTTHRSKRDSRLPLFGASRSWPRGFTEAEKKRA